MKIHVVTSAKFPPTEGIGTYIWDISAHMVKHGHEVVIHSRHHAQKQEDYFNGSLRIIHHRVPRVPIINSLYFSLKLSFVAWRTTGICTWVYHSPLVLPLLNSHPHNVATIHSTMLEDTKFIESVNLNAVLNKMAGKTYSRFFESILFKRCKKIIIVNKDISEELNRYKFSAEVEYIPNLIDTTKFKHTNGYKNTKIAYIGRLSYRKGIIPLLDALLSLKEVFLTNNMTFQFIGDGQLKLFISTFIKDNDLQNFIEIKSVTAAEIPHCLNELKAIIMPSTYETGPRVVLEAASSGVLCVATRVGLVKNFKDQHFIEISRSASSEIQESLIKVFEMSLEDYQESTDKCYEYVHKNFSIKNNFTKLMVAYGG